MVFLLKENIKQKEIVSRKEIIFMWTIRNVARFLVGIPLLLPVRKKVLVVFRCIQESF